MKIAIISSGFLPVVDGISITLYHRLQQLSNHQHQVLLFCPDYSPLASIYPHWSDYTGNLFPGVTIINLPSTEALGLDFERDFTSKSYPTLLTHLQEFKPDIIHVDEPERLALTFLRLPGIGYAKEAKIPCVAFFHTNYLDYIEDYLKAPALIINLVKLILKGIFVYIYNRYDTTLVSTIITQNKLVKMGIKNTKQANLLGFAAASYTNDLRQQNFWLNNYNIDNIDKKVKLIFLGRLTPDKGWDFALKAFKDLGLDNVAIIIGGEGPLKEAIASTLTQLTPAVYLLGRIEPEKIPGVLANSDIHITNSEKETFGLTILEACAAGIPVIAPQAGGVTDTIQNGENGLLYQPQNPQDFRDKLSLLINNQNQRQQMGAKAKELVKNYTWEKTTQNLLNIWQEIIASH